MGKLLQYEQDKKNNPMVEVMPGFWQSVNVGKELTAAEKFAIDNTEGRLADSPFTIPMIWNM